MFADQIKTLSSLPHSLYRAQQIKDFEGEAAQAAGITLYALMLRAGQACFDVFKTRFPVAQSVVVLVGKGNNGGDGYVFATIAKDAGLNVQLCQLGDPENLTGDAAQARDAWQIDQGVIESSDDADFDRADVIVDALLGTGLSGPLYLDFERLIDSVNRSLKPVLSVDIPSGLNADTGAINDVAVKADATVSFVGLKQGLFTGCAAEYCGQVYFSGLGITEQFIALTKSNVTRVSYPDFKLLTHKRSRISHKGDFGKTLVIGGNKGMPGAVRLSAEAALRTGSGLVKVLTLPENLLAVISGRPELMVEGYDLSVNNDQTPCSGFLNWPTTLVIGPGLGKNQWAKNLFDFVLKSDLKMVVDADALNLLVEYPAWRDHWILTPHPGEAANLLSCSIANVEEDRFSAIRNLQRNFGGIVILKGAGTLICDGKQIYVANVGNPGMASGGMGDLLSGIIGGLLAQGLNPLQAAMLAVCVHGQAADLAAQQYERGLLASDLFPYIRKLVNP